MSYKMLLNKEKFLKTEFGSRLESLIDTWNWVLQQGKEDPETLRDLAWCQAQWEVYQLAMKQFYGIEYHFIRTDEYFGVATEDETDWLMKVERELAPQKKPTPEYDTDFSKLADHISRKIQEYVSSLDADKPVRISYLASHQDIRQNLRSLRCQRLQF